MNDTTTAEALVHTLRSPSVKNNNGEVANVVDAISDLADAAHRIATSINPTGHGGRDANERYVGSLTDAVMGMTEGLCKIAKAIEYLAEAKEREVEVREREFDRTDTSNIG